MTWWQNSLVAIVGLTYFGMVFAQQASKPDLNKNRSGCEATPSETAADNQGDLGIPELTDDGTGYSLRLTLFSPNDGTVAEAVHRYPDLRRLVVTCDHLTVAGLSSLQRLEKLDELVVNSKRRLDDEEFVALSRLTRLKRFRISAPDVNATAVRSLLTLNGLEELGIASIDFDGRGLGDVVTALPRLKQLDLSRTRTSNQSLELLVPAVNLRALSLPQSVTDEGLVHLGALRKLESLMIVHGSGVTDRGLQVIGQFTRLRHLDLTGTSVTDAGLPSLSGLKHLRTLSLRLTRIRGVGLQKLTHLKLLETIDLWGTELQPEHIKLLREFPALRTCNVGWMPHLQEDNAWNALGQLTQLTDLVVDVNRDTLAELRMALPQTEVVTTDLTEWP